MNIKIDKQEYERLLEFEEDRAVFGSRMYGTHAKESDTDLMVFYDPDIFDLYGSKYSLPLVHPFQYDCEKTNSQYLFTTETQFLRNLFSGDSVVNLELAMWDGRWPMSNGTVLRLFKTQKIIKSVLGYAKKDIKNVDTSRDKGNSASHAARGLYIAGELLNDRIPELAQVKHLEFKGKIESQKQMESLRDELQRQYVSGRLEWYPKLESQDTLTQKMLDSVNMRQWKYE